MSHDTHDAHGHHHEPANDKPVVEFKSAFYFVLILAGLFIASIGFVKSMSHTDDGHDAHGAQHTEATGHNEHADTTQEEHHNTNAPAATEDHKNTTAPAEHH